MEQKYIKLSRVQQRQGKIENLPMLASAEFGFAEDSGQLFIGSDPEIANNVQHEAVSIIPFINAREVVQSYLDSSEDYHHLVIDSSLKIIIDDEIDAFKVANYINSRHNENTNMGRHAIAVVDSNIEIVTSKNIGRYANTAEFVNRYSPTTQPNDYSSGSYFKILNSEKGDIFYQIPFNGALYLRIEYMLIQDDGRHVRSGFLNLIGDSTTSNGSIVSLTEERNDLKNIPGGYTAAKKIDFSAEANDGVAYIKFSQPNDIDTKIFYRINRWHVEEYDQINSYNTDHYIGALSND